MTSSAAPGPGTGPESGTGHPGPAGTPPAAPPPPETPAPRLDDAASAASGPPPADGAGPERPAAVPAPHTPWYASGPEHGPPAAPAPLPRRTAAPLGVLVAVGAAFAYVGTVDPNEPGHYPTCPLLSLTGLYCPGCGGLRSAHAFVHGDLPAAFGANAVAVIGYGLFAVLWTIWLVRAVRGVPGADWRIRLAPLWWWATGAAVLAFTVVRNLPVGASLAP
jgi:hypothetical protein